MPGARVTSGERVTLRTVEQEDLPFVQRAGANPEIRYPLGNPVMNREQYEITDEKGTDEFLVCLEGSEAGNAPDKATTPRTADAADGRSDAAADRFDAEADADSPDEDDMRRIGIVNVMDADYKRPELGYWLVPEVHGRGYGKEAVSLVVDYVFRTYDTPAVGAQAFDFNDASRGLLESLGFEKEGRLRKFMFVDGEHRDIVQYGLLRREWRKRERA